MGQRAGQAMMGQHGQGQHGQGALVGFNGQPHGQFGPFFGFQTHGQPASFNPQIPYVYYPGGNGPIPVTGDSPHGLQIQNQYGPTLQSSEQPGSQSFAGAMTYPMGPQFSGSPLTLNQLQNSLASQSFGNYEGMMLSSNFNHPWIIDSGASDHVTCDLKSLYSCSPCASQSLPIRLPDDTFVYATHIGHAQPTKLLHLNRVLFIPRLKFNLLSVKKITSERNCIVIFFDDFCIFQDRMTGQVIGLGKAMRGLYFLQPTLHELSHCITRILHNVHSLLSCMNVNNSCNNDVNFSYILWHRRLGHSSQKCYFSHGKRIECPEFFSCSICPLAKQTRSIFPQRQTFSRSAFDLVHMDLWGPHREPNHDKSRYFLTIVDDFSRATWTFLLRFKDQVFPTIQSFISMVQTQHGVLVKRIRSDNGTEFFSAACSSFLASRGIYHESSCVYTPQQNGVVERKHRHLLDVARALMFQACIPAHFWGDCILTATHIINRLPSPRLGNRSPFEILHGKPPSLDHLRVFGCRCYAKDLRPSDKFSPRAIPCVFLGYPSLQKGYKVYDPDSRKIFVSRDVVFYEYDFPFSSSQSPDSSHDPPSDQAAPVPAVTQSCDPLLIPSEPPHQESSGESSSGPHIPSSDIHPQPADPPETSASGQISEPLLEPSPEEPSVAVRRSSRPTRPPIWTADYICSTTSIGSNSRYPISDHISLDHFYPQYRNFVASISTVTEPETYHQALKDNHWVDAMDRELSALEANRTWDVVTLPPGRKAIGCKWVYKVKYRGDGTIERYKARLVAKGYTQREGIDYDETFSPVVKSVTVRSVMSIASVRNWCIHQLDVQNAFLHGDLMEEVYMQLPPGFSLQGERSVCRLRKSIYGLKQASRQWYAKFTDALLAGGFRQSLHDYALFTRRARDSFIILLFYVDDILVTGDNLAAISEFKRYLHSVFHMKDLGQCRYFLGIEIARSPKGIYLSQRKYALELVSEAGLGGSKPAITPLEPNIKLTTVEYDEGDPDRRDDPLLEDHAPYQRMIGRLIYLTHTRPDICFTVQQLSQFTHAPKRSHMDAAVRLLKYIKGTPGLGIFLPSSSKLQLTAYCDSDYATCPMSRKCVTGYCIMLGDSLVSWLAKKQPTVSRSSAESEYRAMGYTVCEIIWLLGLFLDLGVTIPRPVSLFCDNEAAGHIAANPIFHQRTKHIEIDCHFVREKIQRGIIRTCYVNTREQPADLFTKALCSPQHHYLLSKLGVFDLYKSPA